jgi:hypothetical protein
VSRRKFIQKTYSLILRGGDLLRRIFSPDPRNGDAAKNSARLPARLVFRCHSSAPTTMAAVRPLLVMVCGPSKMARWIISLNFDLASATVQLGAPVEVSLRVEVVMVIIVIPNDLGNSRAQVAQVAHSACLSYK